MTKKRKSLKELYAEKNSILDGVADVITMKEENTGIDLHLKAIDCRAIKIDTNQRRLPLSPSDIAVNGEFAAKKNNHNFNEKKAVYESLIPMSASIKENGLQNPISVYSHKGAFYLKSGQRRLLASLIAGKKTILARTSDQREKGYDLEITQWIENFHREGLSTKDMLAAIKNMAALWQQKEGKPITAGELGKALYCSKGQASKYFSLLQAPVDITNAIENGQLTSIRKAYELTRIGDERERKMLLKGIILGEISQAEMSELAAVLASKNSIKTRNEPSLRGRKKTKANLGKTESLSVVKDLIDAVLSLPKYKKLSADIGETNFEDFKLATKTFKKLLEKMESVSGE